MMCVLKYEGVNLSEHLQKGGSHVYDNNFMTGSPTVLIKHCVDVAKAMVYVNQLNVSI